MNADCRAEDAGEGQRHKKFPRHRSTLLTGCDDFAAST
jgi:hypothetical protein